MHVRVRVGLFVRVGLVVREWVGVWARVQAGRGDGGDDGGGVRKRGKFWDGEGKHWEGWEGWEEGCGH